MNPEPPQSPALSKPGKTPDKASRPGGERRQAGGQAGEGAPAPLPKPPPLFRRIDWLALLICFAVVETIYLSTLAPELTLEDSGELLTGSFWAGIPHPPGYPFWAIYSWLWTQLVPFGNVAWRVELGQAAAMGLGCSLIALMVSRGSSMLMEGIEELRGMVGKWESAICAVCGVTAGLLMALDNSMWKESVAINRISEFGVPWLILVLLCMMRWIYAPHQRGYLYCAFYCLGICSTIHQTLIVALMGVEIGVACTQPKLGRDLFLLNTLGWVAGLVLFEFSTPIVEAIFNVIGVASLIACVWLTIRTTGAADGMESCLYIILLITAGCSFYFYEAIAGMTNPPMEWGYPRTVQGFFHALTRGQYEKINPTNIIAHPDMFMVQLKLLAKGVADAFNWVFMFFAAAAVSCFSRKMQRRERNWLIYGGGDLSVSGGAADDLPQSAKGPAVGGIVARVFRGVAHDGGDPDRLRAGADGGLHGDALREIPALGHGWAARRRWCWRVYCLLGHGGETLLGAGRGGGPERSAALGGAGVCAGAIRPAHFRQLDPDRAAGRFSGTLWRSIARGRRCW